MAVLSEKFTNECFEVIHPLDDAAEAKRNPEGLGRIEMSRTVRLSLTALRVYLIAISLLLLYHVVGLAGVMSIR